MSNLSFEYAEEINPNLLCSICQEPFVQPVQSHCGHIFCFSCLHRAIEVKPNCPIDRKPLSVGQIQPAVQLIQNMVNELMIYCPNRNLLQQELVEDSTNTDHLDEVQEVKKEKEKKQEKDEMEVCDVKKKGCQEKFQRQFLQNHLKECLFSVIDCPNPNCNTSLIRRNLTRHLQECLYNAIKCELCNEVVVKSEMEQHLAHNCAQQKVECEYCCKQLHKWEMEEHHLENCENFQIKCPHNCFGCLATFLRNGKDSHLKECPYEAIKHILYSQKQKNEELESKIHIMEDQLRRWNDDLLLMRETGSIEMRNNLLIENSLLRQQSDALRDEIRESNITKDAEMFRMREEIQFLHSAVEGLRMQVLFLSSKMLNSSSFYQQTTGSSGFLISPNPNIGDQKNTAKQENKL